MAYEKAHKLHIVAVTAVIRNTEGKYLVLKRSEREIAFPGLFCFPGGKVEGDDTVEETLRKEIAEEAGLQMKPRKFLLKDTSFIRPDGQTVKVFTYLCEVEDAGHVTISDDFTEYRWVTPDEVASLPHVGIIVELKHAEEIRRLGLPLSKLGTAPSRTN